MKSQIARSGFCSFAWAIQRVYVVARRACRGWRCRRGCRRRSRWCARGRRSHRIRRIRRSVRGRRSSRLRRDRARLRITSGLGYTKRLSLCLALSHSGRQLFRRIAPFAFRSLYSSQSGTTRRIWIRLCALRVLRATCRLSQGSSAIPDSDCARERDGAIASFTHDDSVTSPHR